MTRFGEEFSGLNLHYKLMMWVPKHSKQLLIGSLSWASTSSNPSGHSQIVNREESIDRAIRIARRDFISTDSGDPGCVVMRSVISYGPEGWKFESSRARHS